MLYVSTVRSTRWPLASCALVFGLLTACSQNKGPATSAYLRECDSFSDKLAGQIRELSTPAPPNRPVLPPNPTANQQRVFDGMMRIYPLYVNEFYVAVMERCQILDRRYGEALDGIGALNAADVDPAGIQLMTLRVQLIDRRRDFFAELRRLADYNQTAMVRRKAVDDVDEILVGLFNSAIAVASGGDEVAAADTIVKGLKDVAGAASRRPAGPFGIGEQVARVTESATRLQRDTAAYQGERDRLAADLRSRFPGQDWGAAQPRQGTPAH